MKGGEKGYCIIAGLYYTVHISARRGEPMVVVAISLAVMAVTMVVVAAFAIPTLLEIRKTASATREFLASRETELKPIIRDLQETLADLRVLTQGAAEKVDDVQTFMEAVGDAGRNLRTINTVVGSVAALLGSSSAWISGAKVAGTFLINRLSKKRG
jgi:uncharacterized protein YoxC